MGKYCFFFALVCLMYCCECKVFRTKVDYLPPLEQDDLQSNSVVPSRTARKNRLFLKDTDSEEKDTVFELANFAIDTLDRIDPENRKRALLDVLDSKKQFVNGVMYHLTLLVGTVSEEQVSLIGGVPVKETDIVDRSICKIQVLRSWAGTDISPINAQVVESECVPEQKINRLKRSPAKLVGGKNEVDVNRPDIVSLASKTLAQADSSSGRVCSRNVNKIHRAKSQIVAGVLYELKMEVCAIKNCEEPNKINNEDSCEMCDVVVVERAWESSTDVSKFECVPKTSVPPGVTSVKLSKSRSKRSARHSNFGGMLELDPKHDDIDSISSRAVKKIDEDLSRPCDRQVTKILEAKKQNVAGLLYHLKLEVCEMPDCNDVNRHSDGQYCEVCMLKVLVQPWRNIFDVPEATCVAKVANLPEDSSKKEEQELYAPQFEEFIQKFNKNYNEEEKRLRFRVFRANMKKIEYLQKTEQGSATYGVTQFADLTGGEFRKYYLGFNPSLRPLNSEDVKYVDVQDDIAELPNEFDWRSYNVVTPVKNQGMCGSCWAFSVTGNVEGQYALKHKQLLSFSEQELVDCDKTDDGCEGGYMTNGYKAIQKLGGLESEQDYPYEGRDDKCKFIKNESRASVIGSLNITSNETKMAQWLYKNGPISIAINANAMQFYFGGVSHPLKFLCEPQDVNHGVLLVGFGVHKTKYTKKNLPYWLIKNSWGRSWGEKGYYKLYRGAGVCGVNTFPSSAIVS